MTKVRLSAIIEDIESAEKALADVRRHLSSQSEKPMGKRFKCSKCGDVEHNGPKVEEYYDRCETCQRSTLWKPDIKNVSEVQSKGVSGDQVGEGKLRGLVCGHDGLTDVQTIVAWCNICDSVVAHNQQPDIKANG